MGSGGGGGKNRVIRAWEGRERRAWDGRCVGCRADVRDSVDGEVVRRSVAGTGLLRGDVGGGRRAKNC